MEKVRKGQTLSLGTLGEPDFRAPRTNAARCVGITRTA